MKKIYLLAAVMFAFGTTFAQVSTSNKAGHLKTSFVKKLRTNKTRKPVVVGTLSTQSTTPTDTLGLTQTGPALDTYFYPSAFNIYGNTGGGYVLGTNVFSSAPGFTEIAQGYLVTANYTVIGALVWFGAKQFAGTDASAHMGYMVSKEYKMAANAATTDPSTTPATLGEGPSTQIGSTDTLLLSAADTSSMESLTPITFHTPVYVTNGTDFAISIGLNNLYAVGDTVGIVDDAAGDAASLPISNFCFGKYGTTWYGVNGAFGGGLDFSAIIYAVVAQSLAGVNDNYFIDGLKLGECAPNPAIGNTSIQYELQNNAKGVDFKFFDVTGRLVKDVNEGAQTSGKHTAQVDVSSLASGTYYYSLRADGHNLTKKMVVVK